MPQQKQSEPDDSAFIGPYREELRRFFATRAGPQNADELVQALCLRLIKYPPPPELDSPRAFYFKIAVYVLHSHRKAERLDRQRFLRGDDAAQHIENAAAADFVNGLEAKQELDEIVKQLPWRQAAALLLLKRDGFRYDEIAELLEVSFDTVKKDLVRAMQYIDSRRVERRKLP